MTPSQLPKCIDDPVTVACIVDLLEHATDYSTARVLCSKIHKENLSKRDTEYLRSVFARRMREEWG